MKTHYKLYFCSAWEFFDTILVN